MSHHHIVFSPEGTPLSERTVGELVAERPGRSRIFQGHQIDFCCQGGRTLQEVCKRKGLSLEVILEQMEAEEKSSGASGVEEKNPALLPPDALVEYIIHTHHDFLREELPRLYAMSSRVAQVHGHHTPSVIQVFQVFDSLTREVDEHITKEEEVLFPAIVKLTDDGGEGTEAVESPMDEMMHEHESTGAMLLQLRELTNGYQPPEQACNTWRALYAGLADLEENMHRHIHLENSVLFPVAEELAKKK